MTVSLVGFIAELTGSDDHLLEAQPAVEIDGEVFVAPSLDWDLESLLPFQPSPQAVLHLRKQARRKGAGDGAPSDPGSFAGTARRDDGEARKTHPQRRGSSLLFQCPDYDVARTHAD